MFYSDKGWREKRGSWGEGSDKQFGYRAPRLHRRSPSAPPPLTKATAYWAVPSFVCKMHPPGRPRERRPAAPGAAAPRTGAQTPPSPKPGGVRVARSQDADTVGSVGPASGGRTGAGRAAPALEGESATSTDSASSSPPSPAAPGPRDAAPAAEAEPARRPRPSAPPPAAPSEPGPEPPAPRRLVGYLGPLPSPGPATPARIPGSTSETRGLH